MVWPTLTIVEAERRLVSVTTTCPVDVVNVALAARGPSLPDEPLGVVKVMVAARATGAMRVDAKATVASELSSGILEIMGASPFGSFEGDGNSVACVVLRTTCGVIRRAIERSEPAKK